MNMNRKGFSLIGVMVASVIGIIVVAGVNQSFVNMSFQLKKKEIAANKLEFKKAFFSSFSTGCKKTLENNAGNIASGAEVGVRQLKGQNGGVLFDLDSTDDKEKIAANYDFYLDDKGTPDKSDDVLALWFNVSCVELDCNCIGVGTYPCIKRWEARLISMSKTRELTQLNKPDVVDFVITYSQDPNTPAKERDFVCNSFSINSKEYDIKTDTSRENILIGNNLAIYNSNIKNTLIGYGAGQAITGNGNIFIGHKAGKDLLPSYNNMLIIGNDSDHVNTPSTRRWIVGEIGTDTVSINDKNICLADGTNCIPSSKTLKTKIKPFYDFNNSLEVILNTPLFTYKYKNNLAFNPKPRMGFISEKLPKNLQINDKGKVSQPDWPTIYGTLWAGVKALYNLFRNNEKDLKKELEQLRIEVKNLKEKVEINRKRIVYGI